jgi:hypothetical protein
MGATIALPLLDAMVPAMAQTPAPQSRYSFLHVPHGAAPGYWRPTGTGKNWELSRILTPIAPFKDRITVISGTDHRMATSLSPEESAGDHSRTAAVYLSAAHPKRTEGQDIEAGITIDQVLANKIGQQSPLPSLELCIEDVGSLGVCGVGYSCAYTNSISWSSPTSPLPMERNPQVVFERLFGDGGTAEARAARKREGRCRRRTSTRPRQRRRSRPSPGGRSHTRDRRSGSRLLPLGAASPRRAASSRRCFR